MYNFEFYVKVMLLNSNYINLKNFMLILSLYIYIAYKHLINKINIKMLETFSYNLHCLEISFALSPLNCEFTSSNFKEYNFMFSLLITN